MKSNEIIEVIYIKVLHVPILAKRIIVIKTTSLVHVIAFGKKCVITNDQKKVD
jgi:hypothetical protein